MAEPISIQQLKDASEDAITLADFIYKPANVMIPRRLAADINSLQYYLDYMKTFAQRSYETYDDMVANASNLSENVSAFVTNDLDTSKNGIYTYNGTSFVKGDYQPENAAKDFVEDMLDGLQVFEGKVRAQDVSTKLLNISQEDINNGLLSTDDLINLSPNDNAPAKVYIRGYQGGSFVYDETKEGINDGGAIINGWVRELPPTTGWVTPQMFGAKADGVTYDDLAINKCIKFAEQKNKMIWMGGRDCTYLVKYSGEATTFGSIFNITEGFNMHGARSKIKVNQEPVVDTDNTQYALFRINRPTAQIGNYQYIVKDICFSGLDFEGGYVFENDTEKENLNDKHKLRAITSFEVRTNNLAIVDCGFKDFAQNNTIASFYSTSFDNYGIGKGVLVDRCSFINCGYEGDHSTLYFMDDDVAVTRCIFHVDKEYNNFGSHAVEFHGKNSYMDRCAVNNYLGGLIFGTNTQSGAGLLGGLSATGNTFRTYGDAFSIWSGEVAQENGLDDINITGNTATLIDFDGRLLEIGASASYRAFLSTPIVGKILGSVNAQDNIIISESSLPVYGADIAVGGGIQPELINFSNNTLKGVKSALKIFSRVGGGVIYHSVNVSGNKSYHYENKGEFNIVSVETSNTVDDTLIRGLTVNGNTMAGFVPTNMSLIDVKSGDIGWITVGGNNIPDGGKVLSLNGSNVPTINSAQKLGVSDYLTQAPSSGRTVKPSVDTVRYKFPITEMQNADADTKLTMGLGFINSGTRIVSIVGRLSVGLGTSGIPINAEFKAGEANLVAPTEISNKQAPFFGAELDSANSYIDNSSKLLTLNLSSYDTSVIAQLKGNGGDVTVDVHVEKLML